MASWPIWIKVILELHLIAFGAFCVYGMTGLKFKEENPSKLRKVAAYACGIAVIAFLIFLAKGWLDDPTREEEYKNDLKESYEEGYDDGVEQGYDGGYDDGHADGYGAGYDDGYTEGYGDGYTEGYDEGWDDRGEVD